ncbi:MAG TPA: aldo/keto reductase [Leptolyngbyaceae cyanobacterium]
MTGEKKNQDTPEMITQISKLTSLSEKYQVSPVIIALEYVLRFSQGFYPVLGTSNPNHLEESLKALEVNLSVEDFADLSVVPTK